MIAEPPLVTVAVPVRNGESTLRRALESLVRQTYPTLKILVSDNCSTDGTAAIVSQFAARDPRVTYIRQAEPLTAWQHFGALVALAEGEYFMWAADDDSRNDSYIEHLVSALEEHPTAVLSFGTLVQFYEDDESMSPIGVTKNYAWDGTSHNQQLNALFQKCARIYGLFRTKPVSEYSWLDTEYGPDVALLLYARMRGDFVYAPEAVLYEAVPRGHYQASTRAQDHNFSGVPRFPIAKMAWCCMEAAAEASTYTGTRPRRPTTFALSYLNLKMNHARISVFPRLPSTAVSAWRRYKGWRASRLPGPHTGPVAGDPARGTGSAVPCEEGEPFTVLAPLRR